MPRLKEKYLKEVAPALKEELNIENVNNVPRMEKIVVNMGVGGASSDAKLLEAAMNDMRTITGQQPCVTRARKSIAGFKIRAGQAIGCKVTLRGDRMWEFMDRLLSTALPRVRDFRGIPATSFDGRGNYSLGVTEQLIFSEIDFEKIDRTRGMDITFVTTAKDNASAFALLKALGFPFAKTN
ncbi:MAG: 50S ribosomal protein L5 [Eggerthellaceae bacterium]|nr:50S ribosomal protein L5 [Eggerthellaceae bacterium]